MIEYIFLSIFGLSCATGGFIYLSLWGTKILYAEKIKDLYKNKDEIITIMKARILNLEIEGKKDNEEHKTLNVLLNDLITIK